MERRVQALRTHNKVQQETLEMKKDYLRMASEHESQQAAQCSMLEKMMMMTMMCKSAYLQPQVL